MDDVRTNTPKKKVDAIQAVIVILNEWIGACGLQLKARHF